jgi:CheY-like chemotaxis protein
MSKKILIVDDIEFIVEFERKIIGEFSRENGVKIITDTAGSVSDALEMIHKYRYDAMVVDIHLPDGSGLDIIKSAQVKHSDTRIAVMTLYPQKYEHEREHCDLFMNKPILPVRYKEHLKQLLQL